MDLLAEVYKTVKKIDNEVGQLLQWKAAHVERHESVEDDIQDVHNVLFNTDGLVSRVQRLQGCKNGIEKKRIVTRQFILSTLSKVLAGGVIAAITWVIVRN